VHQGYSILTCQILNVPVMTKVAACIQTYSNNDYRNTLSLYHFLSQCNFIRKQNAFSQRSQITYTVKAAYSVSVS